MRVTKRDSALALLYLFAAIAVFPSLYYLVQYYVIGFTIDTPDRFGKARVFLTGPVLVLVGIALISLSKNRMNRGFGIVFLSGGVAWMVMVVYALLTME